MVASTKPRYSRKAALAAEPEWSHYQLAVFDAIANSNQSLRIGAVAGSGKTTLITGIVNRIPADTKIAVLAFNTHIVETLKQRLPSRITVTTAHGMGYGLLSRYFQGEPIQVEENKYRKIARNLVQSIILRNLATHQSDKQTRKELANFLNHLIRGCQATLIDPTVEGLLHLIDYYGIERFTGWKLAVPLVTIALSEGEKQAATERVIDFGDQLWLLHRWNLQPVAKDFVLLDEIQDANPAQLALYKKLVGADGRAIAVGDSRQAIQGFAFAAPQMWDQIEVELNTQTLALSVCYRCPSSHLDLARSIVPQIEPREDAPTGKIQVLHPSEVRSAVQTGDLILCRFTAPLIALCLRLVVSGVQAKVRGRDIGSQLIALAQQASEGSPYSKFLGALTNYCLPKIAEYRDRDEDSTADSLADRYTAIQSCYTEFGAKCQSLAQFCDRMAELFSDAAAPVILSTIHRAKGDEANTVFLLGCNDLPYTAKAQKDWQIEQEHNLLYVALTRAKQSLYLVPLHKDPSRVDEFVRHQYGGLEIEPVPFVPSLPPATTDPDFYPGDRVTVYQYSDPTVTLSDRARLRSASANPWQLPPERQQWRKLRLWGDWPIIVLSTAGDRVFVTSPHFSFPLCSEGVQVPLTHIELTERGAYASVLERIRNGEPITDASAISADADPQIDRPSFRRKPRKGGELHRGDRTAADREAELAQPALF